MIAIDTNIIVRVLTADDPTQTKIAADLLRSNAVWISKTVLLETEWVLRHGYKLPETTINTAFQKLLRLPQVHTEEPACIALAIRWHAQGADFADAVHLASSGSCASLATFDKKLRNKAAELTDSIPVYIPTTE